MAKKKFYAVAVGRIPGIYNEWAGKDGAQDQTIRFSGATFQGFPTRQEAEDFMKQYSESRSEPQKEKYRPKYRVKSFPVPGANNGQQNGKVIMYTDGGCIGNPGPGGYGVVIRNGKKTKELSAGYKLTTNNRMELMACIVGLSSLKKPSSVELYSDSKYVVDGITKGWAKSWKSKSWIKSDKEPAKNPDLWEQLLDLCEKHEVEFCWVKGHAGVEGNERCDELATQAASQKKLPADEYFEIAKV